MHNTLAVLSRCLASSLLWGCSSHPILKNTLLQKCDVPKRLWTQNNKRTNKQKNPHSTLHSLICSTVLGHLSINVYSNCKWDPTMISIVSFFLLVQVLILDNDNNKKNIQINIQTLFDRQHLCVSAGQRGSPSRFPVMNVISGFLRATTDIYCWDKESRMYTTLRNALQNWQISKLFYVH